MYNMLPLLCLVFYALKTNKQTLQRKSSGVQNWYSFHGHVNSSHTQFCHPTLVVGSTRSQVDLRVLPDVFDAEVWTLYSHQIANAGENNTKKQGEC